jgi:4-amino-4-deoxy-L-arabinose transferase-like glycosyltransferase
MPLYPLTLAAWGRIFGFSVFSVRVPSLLWGVLLLASTWGIVQRLGGRDQAAALATAILAVEFGFVDSGSDVRMDMMAASLGFCGLAAYLSLRDGDVKRATLVGHTLCAMAVFTHPNGIFAAAGIGLCMLWLDLQRISFKLIALTGVPYVVGACAWGLYILRAPADFAAQFGANSVDRSRDLLHPLHGIRDEFVVRYLQQHFMPSYSSPFVMVKLTGLLLFAGATAAIIAIPPLRQQAGTRLLLALAGLRFLMMSIGASWKLGYYLVHILPFYAAIAGIAGYWFWSRRGMARRMVATVMAAYFLVQLAVFSHLVTTVSAYRKKYLPAVACVKSLLGPNDLVVGSAELAFSLGFDNPQLTDDIWFGRWSGRRPTIAVVDEWYYYECITSSDSKSLEYRNWAQDLLRRDFSLIKALDGYSIYRRIHQ